MFPDKKTVLGDVAIVKIGDPQVQQDIQDHRKIEKRKIKPVTLGTHHILHRTVNTQHPKRLYQQIQENQQNQVGNKLMPQESEIDNSDAKIRYFGHTLYF